MEPWTPVISAPNTHFPTQTSFTSSTWFMDFENSLYSSFEHHRWLHLIPNKSPYSVDCLDTTEKPANCIYTYFNHTLWYCFNHQSSHNHDEMILFFNWIDAIYSHLVHAIQLSDGTRWAIHTIRQMFLSTCILHELNLYPFEMPSLQSTSSTSILSWCTLALSHLCCSVIKSLSLHRLWFQSTHTLVLISIPKLWCNATALLH